MNGRYVHCTDAQECTYAYEYMTLCRDEIWCVDVETTGLDPHKDTLRLVTIGSDSFCFIFDVVKYPEALLDLKELFQTHGPRVVVGHNLKFDLQFLMHHDVYIYAALFDTYLASVLIDYTNRHGLAACAERDLGIYLDKTEQTGQWARADLTEQQLEYASRDVDVPLKLRDVMIPKLKESGQIKAAQIEFECTYAFAAMEYNGMPINAPKWASLAKQAQIAMGETEQRIFATVEMELGANTLFGYYTKLGSSDQVIAMLDRLGIEVPWIPNKNGIGTTQSIEDWVLASIEHQHPVIPMLREHSKYTKRATTYGTAWLAKWVHPITKRVHGEYRQLGTRSGRASAANPNIQNIPRHKDYRGCFEAEEGRCLIKADYSGQEIRLAAIVAQEQVMLKALEEGADLHRRTASGLFGVPEEQVTKAQRQIAKAINFGFLYGMGAAKLVTYAKTTYGVTLTLQEAQRHRTAFFDMYPDLRAWHRTPKECMEDVRTLTGRVRRDTLKYSEKLNTPVQGSGADCLKAALAALWKDRAAYPDAKLVATVHDEIVMECPIEQAEAVSSWIQHHMTEAMSKIINNRVPAEVEATVGKDWAGTPLDMVADVAA